MSPKLLVELARALDGYRAPGGCDDCHAEQELSPSPHNPRVARLTIYHDETCPALLARQRKSA